MRKSHLKDGTPIFVVTVKHNVTQSAFIVALTDYFYNKSVPFNEELTKIEAKKILYYGLFHDGLNGAYHTGFFEAVSEEVWDARNSVYMAAEKWVTKNYPYLKNDLF